MQSVELPAPPSYVDVVALLTGVPGVSMAQRESDLAGSVTHYLLGPPEKRLRVLVPDVRPLREALARALRGGGPDVIQLHRPYPALQPCLVASLRLCFTRDSSVRCRVAFDLDAADVDSCEAAGFSELHRLLCDWLDTVAPVDQVPWATVPCVLLSGSFPDKPRSAHMLFGRCWANSPTNCYKVNRPNFAPLNRELKRYGYECDASITSSGLKMPFSDKWLHSQQRYRQFTMLVSGLANVPNDQLTFTDCFDYLDPRVYPHDPHYGAVCNFVAPAPAEVPRAAPRANAVVVQAQGGAVEEELARAFPEWRGAVFQRKQLTGGHYLLIVSSSDACPLKSEPSSDAAAYRHASKGKSYVCVDPMGNATIRCHVCGDKQMLVRAQGIDDVLERAIVERFNANYAVAHGSWVIEYAKELTTGEVRPHQMLSRKDFENQETRNGERVNKSTFPKVWLGSAHATRFPLGVGCYPNGVHDSRVFNTWLGFPPALERAAAEVPDDVTLADAAPNWYTLVTHNVCHNDPALVAYFFNWCAHMVQQPGTKPGVALVMMGAPGCGKGLTAQMLLRMVGPMYAVQAGPGDLTDNFNAFIIDKLLVFADEAAAATDTRSNDKLKMLITETQLKRSEKYQANTMANTFQRILFASNSNNAVFSQPGERRFCTFNCAFVAHPRDSMEARALFELVALETEDPLCHARLFRALQLRDISRWVPQVIPTSNGSWQLQFESFTPCERFVYRMLCTGSVLVRNWEPTNAQEALVGAVMTEINRELQAVRELGWDIFDKADRHLPKQLVLAAFQQQFPNSRVTEGQLWKYLYSLVPQKDWHFERRRKPKNAQAQIVEGGAHEKDGGRLVVFVMPARDTLSNAFLQQRGGGLDQRIFNEWAME